MYSEDELLELNHIGKTKINDIKTKLKNTGYELPKRKTDHQKFQMHLDWWKNKIGCYYLNMITPALITQCKETLETEPSPKPKNGRNTSSKKRK